MRIFKYRPLALFCFAFLLVSVLFFALMLKSGSSSVALTAIFVFASLTATAIPVSFIIRRFAPAGIMTRSVLYRTVAVSLASLLSLCICGSYFLGVVVPADNLIGETHSIIAYPVASISTSDFYSYAEARVVSLDGKKCAEFNTVVISEGSEDFSLTRYFGAEVTFASPEDELLGDIEAYYAKGIYNAAIIDKTTVPLEKIGQMRGLFTRANRYLSLRLQRMLDDDTSAFADALLLGNRESLPDSVSRDFRTFGISHILAISGMHLALLLGAFEAVMRCLHIKMQIRTVILFAFCALYMGLCGMTLSVVRSGIMFIIMLTGRLRGEKYDPVTGLFFAGAVIVSVSPSSLLDCGFQLSFLATLGLVTFGSCFVKSVPKRMPSVLKALVSSCAVTSSALIMTLPVVWLRFGFVSAISVLSNLVFTPIVSVFLYCTPLLLLAADIPFVGQFLAYALSRIYSLIRYLLSFADEVRFLSVSLRYGFVNAAIILIALSCLAVLLFRFRAKWVKFVPVALTAALLFACIFLRGNAGDGVLFYSDKISEAMVLNDSGKTALIDISPGYRGTGRKAYELAEQQLFSSNIDAYILTHLHSRHLSCFTFFADNYYLDYLILPEPVNEGDRDVYEKLVNAAGERNISVIAYAHDSRDARVSFCSSTITVSQKLMLKRSTHPVVLFRADGEYGSITYAGGSCFEALNAKSERYPVYFKDCDCIIFGTHSPVYKPGFELLDYDISDSRAVFASEQTRQFILNEFPQGNTLLEGNYTVIK